MKEYLENLETTTLLTGIGIGMAVCLLIPPIYRSIKTWWSSSDNSSPQSTDIDVSSLTSHESSSEQENTSSSSDNIASNDTVSKNTNSETISTQDTISSGHSTTTSDTTSELSQQDDNELDVTSNDSLENPEIPLDVLIIELSKIFSLESINEQIETLMFIIPFLNKISQTSYDCIKDWWDNTYSGELDPTLMVYMNDILFHLNTLLSQM